MHSPSISIFNSLSKRPGEGISSTGFGGRAARSRPLSRAFRCQKLRMEQEVPCLTVGCRARARDGLCQLTQSQRRERKESVKFLRDTPCDSNRKERQFSAFEPLFNRANTSGIRLFADRKRQSSAWADDVVMDSGAEGAARGCDAV